MLKVVISPVLLHQGEAHPALETKIFPLLSFAQRRPLCMPSWLLRNVRLD